MSSVTAAFRLMRAGWVLVREGVVAAMPGDELSGSPKLGWRMARLLARRRALRRGRGDRLARAVARLGPSYVKLGQFLATRPDVVGNDIAVDLAMLQDKMQTFPKTEAVEAIEGSLGRPVGALYVTLDDAVAAASIAQVHPAEVDHPDGPRKVAVKVIRPGVRRRFQHDLESFFLAARLQERFIPSTRRLRPVEGLLAADSLIQAPRRTGTSVAALMLSLALAVAFAGTAQSAYRTMVDWMNTSLNADLYVLPSERIDLSSTHVPF